MKNGLLVFIFAVACGPRLPPTPAHSGPALPAAGAPVQARSAYLAGLLALERGQLDEAAVHLANAARFDPGAPELRQAVVRLQAARLEAAQGPPPAREAGPAAPPSR